MNKEPKHMKELKLANHPKLKEIDAIIKNISVKGHSMFSLGFVKRAIETGNFHEWDNDDEEYGKSMANQLHDIEDMVMALSEEHRKDLITLLNYDNLTPLTLEDDEWSDVTSLWGDDILRFQNNRKFSIFKEGKDGRPYSVADILCIDEDEEVYTRHAFVIDGIEYTLKLYPKDVNCTPDVYVKVYSKEEGDEHFVYFKSEEEIEKIKKYYDIGYTKYSKELAVDEMFLG